MVRTHYISAFLLATLLSPIVPSLALGADDSEVRRELEQQYQELAWAHGRGDHKAIVGLLTSDFRSINSEGVYDFRATKEYYEKMYPDESRYTIRELTVSEDRLAAVAEVYWQSSMLRTLAGAERRIEFSCMKRDTWTKTRKGWKLKLVDHVRDAKKFVDGKRVDPTKQFDPDAPPYEPPEKEGKDMGQGADSTSRGGHTP